MFNPFVFFYLLAFQLLCAEDIRYSFSASKQHLYLNEPLVLEVNISQIDNSKVMLFKFSPKPSASYDFYQIDFHEQEKYHDLEHQYTYLIYPKKTGKVLLDFEMIKSITDDDKVAYSISGDRDNVKGLEKEDIVVALDPLVLEVKALAQEVDLIGDFAWEYHLDKKVTEVFDPIHLKVKLKGEGQVEAFELLEASPEYKLFSQKPLFKRVHSKEGTQTFLEWNYALSSDKSFTLAKKVLKAFDPEKEKFYELILPSFNIHVEAIEEEKLLDKEDNPKQVQAIDWSYFLNFLSYLLVFLAGWLMPKDIFSLNRYKSKPHNTSLEAKIAASKTHKELLERLVLENKREYTEVISVLEAVVYHNAKKSLSEIKKMIESR